MYQYTTTSGSYFSKHGSFKLLLPTEIPIGLKSFLVESVTTDLHIANVPYFSTDDKIIIKWNARGRYRKSEKHAEYQKTIRIEHLKNTDLINALIGEASRIKLEGELLNQMFDELCKAVEAIGKYKESDYVLQ